MTQHDPEELRRKGDELAEKLEIGWRLRRVADEHHRARRQTLGESIAEAAAETAAAGRSYAAMEADADRDERLERLIASRLDPDRNAELDLLLDADGTTLPGGETLVVDTRFLPDPKTAQPTEGANS